MGFPAYFSRRLLVLGRAVSLFSRTVTNAHSLKIHLLFAFGASSQENRAPSSHTIGQHRRPAYSPLCSVDSKYLEVETSIGALPLTLKHASNPNPAIS
ncbi:hypothetical protein SERLADRAFT_396414 [Serpula lacrymans var. lacrymans S7.9]|nr:uncharacterized protein SERLADRAFT_396414 [Serpula lacrymans var. lacrymans S7.9]EGO21517.1 hypothetical protein SERLADRAFT_396414 [Serpula lacrymans var. lacrymans S7.9]